MTSRLIFLNSLYDIQYYITSLAACMSKEMVIKSCLVNNQNYIELVRGKLCII